MLNSEIQKKPFACQSWFHNFSLLHNLKHTPTIKKFLHTLLMNKSVSCLKAALIADTFTSTSSNQQTIFTYPLFSRHVVGFNFCSTFPSTVIKKSITSLKCFSLKLRKIIINTARLAPLFNCEAPLIPRGFKMTRFWIRKSHELPSFDIF